MTARARARCAGPLARGLGVGGSTRASTSSIGSSVNWASIRGSVAVVGLHQVLEERVGRGALGIEPHPGAGGLADLGAVGRR